MAIWSVAVVIGCSANVGAQQHQSEKIPFQTLLKMLSDQPDYLADRTIVLNGRLMMMKVARKQGRIRREFYPLQFAQSVKDESLRFYKLITISGAGRTISAFDPQARTYAHLPEELEDAFEQISLDIEPLFKKMAKILTGSQVERVGSDIIDGHPSAKIRVETEIQGYKSAPIYLYFAQDMENLLLKVEADSVKDKGMSSYTASNVSSQVPDELFEVPKNYRRVEFSAMLSSMEKTVLK